MTQEVQGSLEQQAQELWDSRFPEGLLHVLRGRFPNGREDDYEDAIGTGFLKLVKKGAVENPAGYVTTVAINAMRRLLARAARERLTEDEQGVDAEPSRVS